MAMEKHENIRVIIVDLDRTLLHTDKTLSAYTAEILKKCKKVGIKVIVATARPFRTAKEYCEMIDADGVVVSNGARIIFNNQLTDYGICQESALRVLNMLDCYPSLLITLETGSCAYSNKPIADFETVISDDLSGIAKAEGVLKILVSLENKETLPIVQKALPEDMYYTIANGHLIQIMSKSATKWNGIKAILDIYNCTPEDAIYFGDDHDDVEPIKMCGLGIAVSNGIDEVKAVSDHIAESNDADGVAKLIEQIFLENCK